MRLVSIHHETVVPSVTESVRLFSHSCSTKPCDSYSRRICARSHFRISSRTGAQGIGDGETARLPPRVLSRIPLIEVMGAVA